MEKGLLAEKVSARFTGRVWRFSEPWEQCAWSKSYKVELDSGEVFYLKGTPRSRPEATITSLLHRLAPDYIPAVWAEDLLPDDAWRWFGLEDGGECNHSAISPECAIEAAFCLGRVQRVVCQHPEVARVLPQCRADGLQEALMSVCEWALGSASGEVREELLAFRARVAQSAGCFRALQEVLSGLPDTCVHGDFWSGNIACRAGAVRLIDWGDALWGIGSISIVNLLASDEGALSGWADEVWGGYARGWEREMTDGFVRASQVGAVVGSLVVDMEIAVCYGGRVETMQGLLPGLRALAPLME